MSSSGPNSSSKFFSTLSSKVFSLLSAVLLCSPTKPSVSTVISLFLFKVKALVIPPPRGLTATKSSFSSSSFFLVFSVASISALF
ncbi:hypothetical protein KC19_VG328600 [Ceratodon purpureus]|uniref:Uncharacterized protein n=1 Tax=Ceratodon purpureus TaxID=3225 RepID=A0A8T0HWR3_CERPU|nr:hypothetical protein KC19_VG328600 [Ceratodon purpureus]